jgi:hypothetical protein
MPAHYTRINNAPRRAFPISLVGHAGGPIQLIEEGSGDPTGSGDKALWGDSITYRLWVGSDSRPA